MEINKLSKVHIIGIGGIGTSAVAKLLVSRSVQVTGSDLLDNQNIRHLEDLNAHIHIGEHTKNNVPKDADLVIYSSAVPETNPERQQASAYGIAEYDYHDFIGEMTDGSDTVVVTGTHGKTTTTAMLGVMLSKTNLDPTVIVGSNVPEFDGNVRIGASDHFVIEGDEYKRGLLATYPTSAIITNIEHDHFDIYPTFEDYVSVFQDFVNKIPSDGHFVYNLDDTTLVDHIVKPSCECASFSIENDQADLFTRGVKQAHGRQIFKLVYKGQELKDFNIRIPGIYNVYNALGAALMSFELGVDQDTVKDALATFRGCWRRFEAIGTLKGALVISDYAHHPTEVREVIRAAREFYPENRIVVYFQPHQINRTKNLLTEFAGVLDASQADVLILNEIYDVAGRTEEEKVSSKDIVKKIKREADFVETLDEGIALLKKKLKKDDVLLVLGAGDIDSAIRGTVNN